MLGCKPIGQRSMQRQRCLRLESLETRAMLSHPAVTAVNVASTDWAASFVSHLESAGLGVGGYAIPVGSSAQLQTLPWTNINQIRITFSEDVVIAAADLSVSGVNTTARAFSGFSYDSTSHIATWTLTAPITKDKLLLDLDADGMAPVISVSTGDALTGGWTNGASSFPSGDTQTVADFEFRINALPCDVDGSNYVTVSDALFVRAKIGKTVDDLGYNIRYDVDGSGEITSSDYSTVQTKVGGSLPSGNPAGMTNDAPTTASIPDMFFDTTAYDNLMSLPDDLTDVEALDAAIDAAAADQVMSQANVVADVAAPLTLDVDANSTDYVVSLPDLFADAETLPANMTYTITQNTDPSMFDSLTIDSSGQLTIDLADNASGDAVLTVRATDAGGLIVETSFAVHASNAPFISDFYCINTIGDFWTLTGIVGDYDDPVLGDVITFGGALAGYNLTATADSDGVFTLTVEIIGLEEGTGTAQTRDPHGIFSNLAEYWLIT